MVSRVAHALGAASLPPAPAGATPSVAVPAIIALSSSDGPVPDQCNVSSMCKRSACQHWQFKLYAVPRENALLMRSEVTVSRLTNTSSWCTRTRTRTEAATQAAKVKAEADGGAPASAAAATTDISSGEFRSRVTQAGDAAEEATGARTRTRTRTHTNGISTGLLFRTAAADHGHLHPTQSKSAEACLQRPVSLPKAVSRGTQLG